MGMEVIALPAEPGLPDSVFVEDPAIVLDEIAVITRPGAESRRAEGETLAAALAPFRPLERIAAPATLEGGDVMRVGKTLYVGASARSNAEGVAQLAEIAEAFWLRSQVRRSARLPAFEERMYVLGREESCWRIGIGSMQRGAGGLTIVDVAARRTVGGERADAGWRRADARWTFRNTAAIVESLGWKVRAVDISELRKAEAGVTCSSLIFR